MTFHKGISIKFLLVFLCIGYNVTFASGEIRCIERERDALLKFKTGLMDYYGYLSIWWATETCCNWTGIVCSNTTGHVIALQLPNLYLGGEIKPALLELPHLSYLDLSGNYFLGNSIPEFIGSMRQLEHLNLRNSYFSGVIPPQLGNLTNLRTLDLSYNYLWSYNLNWLSGLSQLSLLNMSRSTINDTNWLQPILMLRSLQILHLRHCSIPDFVPSPGLFANSSYSSLFVLDMAHSGLKSSAFYWLFNISTSLVKLDLSSNELSGPIPDLFGTFITVEYLDLSWNMLEGEIPKSLGNSSHLQILSLCVNKLGGSPDTLIGNVSCKAMVSLEYVVLSFNQFTGPIPDMRACPSLRGVTFSGNKLTGTLPLSVGELSKLNILDVSLNSLDGTVSEANFRNLHELEILDISFNSLTIQIGPDWSPPFQLIGMSFARCKMGQNIPEWIQTQTKLELLDVSDAGLSCEAPKWLWSFSPSLCYFNISFNNINGTIPDLSTTSFLTFHAASNKFSGPIPLFPPSTTLFQLSKNMFSGPISSICRHPHLDQIQVLDLSSNQLLGELPNCWEKMPDLQYLNLANNSFSGEIPPSLGSLQNLGALHLRDNNLSGELPSTFGNHRNLKVIDIGGNKLTGNISWIGANSIAMTYLILGDNRFHGTIPLQVCHLIRLQILDLSKNNFSGDVPDCFFNITAMSGRSGHDTLVYAPGVMYNYISYDFHILVPILPKWNIDPGVLQWKGQEREYTTTLDMLVLIDLSSNSLVGSIPASLSSLKRLRSLNLSRNSLEGHIVPGFGEIERLEVIDLSRNHLSGGIPIDFADLHFLSVLDLSNNNLTGQIPTSTQLQSFNPSVYAGNIGLCGDPLPSCSKTTISDEGDDTDKKDGDFFMQSSTLEFCITLISGFIVGFWGVVGSLVLKRSWRIAYFRFMNAVGDWFCVNTTLFLAKFRSRS